MKITCHYRNDPERGLTDPAEVYDGSQAVCFYFRPSARIK